LYTDDAYTNSSNTSITSPVMWNQSFNAGVANLDNISDPGFAVVFDSYDDGSYYDYNYAVNAVEPMGNWHGNPGSMIVYFDNESSMATSSAEFQFRNYWDNERPNAASISKITVQSMVEFPSAYVSNHYVFGTNHVVGALGNPYPWWL